MNKNQTLLLAILILAIIFSAASIFISLMAPKLHAPSIPTGNIVSSGDYGVVQFIVENSVRGER